MPIYTCEKCEFITDIKCKYIAHENTKKHRRNMGILDDSKGNTEVTQKYHKGNTEVTQNDTIVYECNYCDSTFKHSNSRYRHQKYHCKAKLTLDSLQESHRKELMERDKRIEDLSRKLDKALEKIGSVIGTINTTNNDNSQNINITINAYGKEDLSYLNDIDWLKIMDVPEKGIANLFIETHFNPDHPENKNIRLRNRNSKYLEVHDGDNWTNKHKKKVLSEISDDKRDILETKYDTLQDTMSERQKNCHSTFYDETYYETKNEIMNDLEGIVMDNQ